MAEIRPFKGLRYSSLAGSLDRLVAPPYDVLSPEQRDEYAARDPHNVVHLTLPEQHSDDRSKFVKYARSAARLSEWRNTGILAPEPTPVFYRYVQTYRVPKTADAKIRTALIALIKVEPYSEGVVLPHEFTFPKHKEDRLRLLEATRAHLECIFGLYEDTDASVLRALSDAPGGPEVSVDSDEGVTNRFEPISDPDVVNSLTSMLADKKVWIADGHHRYETALAFRERLGPKEERIPEDYMMMALTSMSDPGLALLATHRIVDSMPIGTEEALSRLRTMFDLREVHSSRVYEDITILGHQGRRAFGIVFGGGRGYVVTPKSEASLKEMARDGGSDALNGLDVSILHDVIFERLLGIHESNAIRYTRDAHEAFRATDQGAAAAFLMNPPSVEDMKNVALGGEKMPQKSTYYFPKILSGLVMWSLNDF